jgi:hypothetical protein
LIFSLYIQQHCFAHRFDYTRSHQTCAELSNPETLSLTSAGSWEAII